MHFRKEDILHEAEFFDERSGRLLKSELKHPRLKEGAIPVLLPENCPPYLQPSVPSARESPSKRRKRLEDSFLQKAQEASIIADNEYRQRVTFSNLQELSQRLQEQKLDNFWTVIPKEESVLILHLSEMHEVLCSMNVTKELNVSVIHKKVVLENLDNFKFPLKVSNINILFNIMSSLKMLSETGVHNSDECKVICDVIIDLFKKLKDFIKSTSNDSYIKFIDFTSEQIYNMNVIKQHRRYSPDFLIFCSLLRSISPHCYKFLRNSNIFILPHESTVRRICAEFNVNPCNEQDNTNFLSYIKQKFNFIEEKEKVISLMIDEIHLKPNFDYAGGKLFGMSHNDSSAASSAFVFMVQSFLSPYKDVAHILPVSSLTAEMFHTYIKKIMIGLENIGFKVISLVTDNNAINKKAVSLFSSPSKLCIRYENPACPERYFYYLFDSVHILKCLRNIWLNQKNLGTCMFYPNFETLLPFCTASFQALKKLHEIECNKLLKYGYGLSEKALAPTSFERQNVKLVLQVINNVVAEGLQLVGEVNNIPHHKETAEYIKILCKWWSVMNVKTLYKGEHKRDEFQKPFTPNFDTDQYKFLYHFVEWLEKWEGMKCTTGGLTKQTHLAITHTTKAMLALAEYCFESLNFDYFLPGKVQTDSLEDRFGSYRMLAGSNYNISIRQIYDTETKLRMQTILPLALKSKSCGEFVLSFFQDKHWDEDQGSLDSDSLFKDFCITPEDIVSTQSSLPILTYISGYAAHKLITKLKCEQCCSTLSIDEALDINVNNEWISKLDRGGLKYPHPDVVCVSQFTYSVVNKLLSSSYESNFISCQNHRYIVKSLILDALDENDIFVGMDECENHDSMFLIKQLVWVFINILLNNFCKKQNDGIQKRKNSQRQNTEIKKSKQNTHKLSTLNK